MNIHLMLSSYRRRAALHTEFLRVVRASRNWSTRFVKMQLSRRLSKFNSRVDTLTSGLSEFDGITELSEKHIKIIERSIMQLQLEWELFIRNFLLDCATGHFENEDGIVSSYLTQSFATREIACHFLLANFRRNPQTREPDWYLPRIAIEVADFFKLSNRATISAELGITPWEVDDLRYFRNFLAHRSKYSALKLRQTGLVAQGATINSVTVAFAYSPSGAKNYQRWSGFMKQVAARATA